MFQLSTSLQRLNDAIAQAGGRCVLVGGCVRDALLGLTPKDFDIEVYGLTADVLQQTLEPLGSIHAVGKNFGVLKVTLDEGENSITYDVALPRTENKQGQGHRGFLVTPDPSLDFTEASARRDFTINAMGYDLQSEQLLDPHGGQKDLKARRLKHVSPAFAEDPLRVFRAAQFKARFHFNVAPDTLALCVELKEELKTLPAERIYGELEKLFLQSDHPAVGLRFLASCGALELFPELVALMGCPQEPEWHPEGDVWYHTLLVVDEAARLCALENIQGENRLILVLAALCHDLAKPPTTQRQDGRIRSRGHESGGAKPTKNLLQRLGVSKAITEAVVPLVREHLKPYQLFAVRHEVSDAALKRLALRVPIGPLCQLAKADCFGRTTPEALRRDDPATEWLWAAFQRLNLHQETPEPIIKGRHLIQLGLQPSPQFKTLLTQAFDAQLENAFTHEEEGIQWLKEKIKKG